MKSLALDVINASAPYEVYWHEASHTYRFRSDYDVVLAIGAWNLKSVRCLEVSEKKYIFA